jgi:hypothetical protein
MAMKRNITLSLEKDLIKKAKILSTKRQTSISQMLGQELKKIVQETEDYERAKRSAFVHLRMGFHMGGKIIASREELHERKGLR